MFVDPPVVLPPLIPPSFSAMRFSCRESLFAAVLAEVLICLPGAMLAADPVRDLQTDAITQNKAPWGYWGPDPAKYTGWTNHSNRLIPAYTFGIDLASVKGKNSVYRDAHRLQQLYGRVPDDALHADAEYFDQTDIARLQRAALAAGKKYVVLIVFDGMDWQTTQAAAIYKAGKLRYTEGRGTGLYFQDYRGTDTDYGFFVSLAGQRCHERRRRRADRLGWFAKLVRWVQPAPWRPGSVVARR